MRGYVKVFQWHSLDAKVIEDLTDPARHKGDGVEIDKLIPFVPPEITDKKPYCEIGEVVFRVEDDGTLKQIEARYDSSG